nr:hypothetical protein [Tanacetum cinerariifolium]
MVRLVGKDLSVCVTLDEDMIEKILSGSPCLESLKLMNCYGYRRIDVTSKSIKKLVFSNYYAYAASLKEDYIDCIKINAPYISSLTIRSTLCLRELVLLDVSSLIKVDLNYSINRGMSEITHEEIFRGLLESLDRVKDVSINDYCWELYSRLKARGATSNCVVKVLNRKHLVWDSIDDGIIPTLVTLAVGSTMPFNFVLGRIDVTSKSVKKLVFPKDNSYREICTYDEAYIDCVKINTPYIASLTITGELILRELVLLDVSSLIKVELDYSIDWELGYSIDWRKSGILDEELLARLKAGSDTSNDDQAENGDREEQIASSD